MLVLEKCFLSLERFSVWPVNRMLEFGMRGTAASGVVLLGKWQLIYRGSTSISALCQGTRILHTVSAAKIVLLLIPTFRAAWRTWGPLILDEKQRSPEGVKGRKARESNHNSSNRTPNSSTWSRLWMSVAPNSFLVLTLPWQEQRSSASALRLEHVG